MTTKFFKLSLSRRHNPEDIIQTYTVKAEYEDKQLVLDFKEDMWKQGYKVRIEQDNSETVKTLFEQFKDKLNGEK